MFPGVLEAPLQFIFVPSLSDKRYSYNLWLLVIPKSGNKKRKVISLTDCKLNCFCSRIVTPVRLHSTKPELKFCAGSKPARSVSEIRDGEDLWQWSRLEIRLNTFRRSTIPQKQIIIIINIIPPPPNISSSNLSFERIYAQVVLTGFYGI